MAQKSKKTITLLIIFIGIAVVFGAKIYFGSSKDHSMSGSFAKIKGSNDAPVKVTEFIDFQCPACAFGAKYLKEVMQRHPELIRLQLKHFPLQMHKHGFLSAQYAECSAEQGKFWQMHDLLLARQNNWKRLDDPRPAFDQMISEAGIDAKAIKECVGSGRADRIIERNRTEGGNRKIRSTPTYFVNGKMVVGKKSLELEINRYLEEDSD